MSASGSGQRRSQKDKERAAYMKRLGIQRTTARCGCCYRIVTIDSCKSRWNHYCWR